MGICPLLVTAADCLKYVLTLKTVFAQGEGRALWTDFGLRQAPRSASPHRGLATTEKRRPLRARPALRTRRPLTRGRSSRRDDARSSLKTGGNGPVCEAVQT